MLDWYITVYMHYDNNKTRLLSQIDILKNKYADYIIFNLGVFVGVLCPEDIECHMKMGIVLWLCTHS